MNQTHGGETARNIISGKEAGTETVLETPYKVEVMVEKYKDTTDGEGKEDIIKTVTLQIKYNVAKKEETIQMKRLKVKEQKERI